MSRRIPCRQIDSVQFVELNSVWFGLSNLVIGYFVADCFAEMRTIVAGGCIDFRVLVLVDDKRFISIWFEEEL